VHRETDIDKMNGKRRKINANELTTLRSYEKKLTKRNFCTHANFFAGKVGPLVFVYKGML
jgi:hypothetical protein